MIIIAPSCSKQKSKQEPRTMLSPLSVAAQSPSALQDEDTVPATIPDFQILDTSEPVVIPPSIGMPVVIPPSAPPVKKARVMHDDPPEFMQEVVDSLSTASAGPIATPKAQQSQPKPAAAEKYDVEKQLVPDMSRAIPANFDETVHPCFMRLPAQSLPQSACQGKFNYSIKDTTGVLIEVQLKNRIFRVIRCKEGLMWNQFLHGSPNVAWRSHDSIEAAFDKAIEMAGSWSV